MSTSRGSGAPRGAGRPGSAARLFGCVAAVCFAAVGVALVSQHRFGMEPCPWCVLQRLIFLAIGVAALAGLAWRGAIGSRSMSGLALLLALCGFASAMWQQLVAARSASCNLTLADKIMNATTLNGLLPDVFEARASCADAAVDLLGVPYALWAAALFAVIAVAMLRVLRTAGRARPAELGQRSAAR